MKFEPSIHKLANGVTVILDPMDLATTNVKVQFATGSRDEAEHEWGLSHFCEHMLCNGTRRFPTIRDRKEFLEYNGAATNASTSLSSLQFFGRVVAENVNVLVDMLGDQLENSLFDPAKIETERGVILDEMRRAMDNPKRQLADFTSGKIFNYRTASYRMVGTAQTISSFTRDQMIEFLGRRLSAKNCIICVSGKINDAADLLKCIERTFAFLPQHDVAENDSIEYTPAIAHNSKPGKENVKIRILFPELWPNKLEFDRQNMSVNKFERHLIRELDEEVRQRHGLVYGIHRLREGNEKLRLSGFSTETAKDNVAQVVALVAKTAHRVYTQNTITDQDLERYTKMNKLADADFLESAGRRCDTLLGNWRFDNHLYDFYQDVELSASITRDEVIENSRGYFDGKMSIITQGADFDADLGAAWRENFK